MKNFIFLFAIATLILSCNSTEFQDQRCKGLLLDSLTNLSKYRDRVVCLENGACGMVKEYQQKIAALESKVDSLTKAQRKTALMHRVKRGKHKAASTRIVHVVVKEPANGVKPFYFDYATQKYFFYDANRNAYYSIDPVNRERRYNN